MNILLTGFEPFGEHQINPSQLLIEALPNQYAGITLRKVILPVDHTRAPLELVHLLEEETPDSIVAFGLAAGRAKISLERVALNLMDFANPDNAGVTIKNQPIDENGPAAYFSTLPLLPMLSGLNKAGIPAELSLSAGAYLCNQVFYALMHTLASQNLSVPAGFIHLPALPEQSAQSKKSIPSMSLDQYTKAAYIIINVLSQD